MNSLDVFYLTKYLRDTGLDICCTDEFLAQFATIALLDDCGYFVYFLKSVGEDDSCIFLNENRCSVQPAKLWPVGYTHSWWIQMDLVVSGTCTAGSGSITSVARW